MLDLVKNKLIVSVQALEGEPLFGSEIMAKLAFAAKVGGAVAFRVQSVKDINAVYNETKLPIIGIIKREYKDSEIYITPTIIEIDELLTTNCEMIALDATMRVRPNNEVLEDLINYIHANNRLVMADISTFEEAINAQELGVDCISTTLCGYTNYSTKLDGPNFELIEKLVSVLKIPLIAEGKINTPIDLKRIKSLNVHSYIVGSAITRVQNITKGFVDVL